MHYYFFFFGSLLVAGEGFVGAFRAVPSGAFGNLGGGVGVETGGGAAGGIAGA